MMNNEVPVLWDEECLNSSIYKDMCNGISAAAAKKQMTTKVYTDCAKLMEDASSDKTVIVIGYESPRLRDNLLRLTGKKKQVILAGLDAERFGSGISSTSPSRRGATAMLIQYLVACKRERIALVACGESSVNDLMRFETLKGYLYTRGCPNPDDAIFFYRERVDESFEAFWEKRENFDAVICPNDYVALCFIRYCEEHGLRVPEDLYVAAFSNRTLSRYCKPSITSMSINFVDVGECSYYAWEFLENHKMEDHQIHITTPSSLIVRESTAYEMHEMDTENAILLDAAHQGGPFYSEPVIANVMHVENCLTQCDALNLKIIQGILNGESYDSIGDRLFLSRSALNYRLKKIFTYAQTQNRKEFESLFRHYFTKENNL